MTAASGHMRIAAVEFPGLIVLGGLLFFASGRRKSANPTTVAPGQDNSNRVFRVFGWILLAGVLLQVAVQTRLTLVDHQQFRPGLIVEYLFELALAYYLMRPGRSRDS